MADVYDGPGLMNYQEANLPVSGGGDWWGSASNGGINGNAGGGRRGRGGVATGPSSMPQGSPYGGPGGYYQGQGYFGDDPFGYTGGSILTPWTQPFQAPPGSGGGYSPPEFQPFKFDDFNYNYRPPEGFGERYDTAKPFWFRDFQPASPFKAPTEADMKADPGYEARMKAGQRALQASKAAQGVLRTGGTAKAVNRYAQETASEEYDKVYGRRKGEQETAYAQGAQTYGIQRGNVKDTYDTNEANRQKGFQLREGAWKDNADVSLRGSELGYNVATGTYDRNLQLHRQQYEDEQNARQAAASAAAANSAQSYNRALDEYKMAYDIFENNQANQFNRLYTLGNMGMNAAGQQGQYGANYAANVGSLYTQQGNAAAAGRVGAANAWSGALGGIGDTVMDYGMYYSRPPSLNRGAATVRDVPYAPGGGAIPNISTAGSGYRNPTIGMLPPPRNVYSGVPTSPYNHG